MKKIFLGLALLASIFNATAWAQAPASLGEAVCLTDCREIPAFIEKYRKSHALKTEWDEINYLLYRIRSSNDKFIRNGSEVPAPVAATFLRWKIGWYEQHHHDKIEDDGEFIEKVLKGSESSGQPYLVILADGKKRNLQPVMAEELNALERYEGEASEVISL